MQTVPAIIFNSLFMRKSVKCNKGCFVHELSGNNEVVDTVNLLFPVHKI